MPRLRLEKEKTEGSLLEERDTHGNKTRQYLPRVFSLQTHERGRETYEVDVELQAFSKWVVFTNDTRQCVWINLLCQRWELDRQ